MSTLSPVLAESTALENRADNILHSSEATPFLSAHLANMESILPIVALEYFAKYSIMFFCCMLFIVGTLADG